MKRKFSFMVMMMITIVILAACAKEVSPESTVTEFIEDMKEFDVEGMALRLSPEEGEFLNMVENEEEEFQKYFIEYMRINAKKIKYEIENTDIQDETAIVSVKFKYIDGGPLVRETLSEYIAQAFSRIFIKEEMTEEENIEMLIGIMEEKNQEIEEAFVEKTVDIKCVKINDQWYIGSLSKDLLDVGMSNILSVGREFQELFQD